MALARNVLRALKAIERRCDRSHSSKTQMNFDIFMISMGNIQSHLENILWKKCQREDRKKKIMQYGHEDFPNQIRFDLLRILLCFILRRNFPNRICISKNDCFPLFFSQVFLARIYSQKNIVHFSARFSSQQNYISLFLLPCRSHCWCWACGRNVRASSDGNEQPVQEAVETTASVVCSLAVKTAFVNSTNKISLSSSLFPIYLYVVVHALEQ